jgi:hypothetical protein
MLGTPFHGGNRGSNPLGDASKINNLKRTVGQHCPTNGQYAGVDAGTRRQARAPWEAALIPDIGIMIAAYIVTRMTALLVTSGGPVLARAFAALTILITVVCAADLLVHGVRLPSPQ